MLAVSGGPDSTALMHLAAAWRPATLPLWVATVDHGFRPEARQEAEAVAAAAAALSLPARVLAWEGPRPPSRLQERAREARYQLLFAFARSVGASHVATAHTLDDQAETLMMRLAAGSGPAGLAGMAPLARRGDILLVRPLLRLRKDALVALCKDRGWATVDDPANRDPRFARARWRRLAPALAAEGLTPERLGRLAARSARVEACLRQCAVTVARRSMRHAAPDACEFNPELFDEPDELVLRVLGDALGGIGAATPVRLERLERLLAALREARHGGRPARRTLRGCTLTLDGAGALTIRAEAARRRGRARPDDAGPAGPTFQSR